MEYFTHEEIAKGLFRIRDISYTASYLLIGKNRVALLDTGIGIFSLKNYIASITPRPVDFIILTHGHLDHANGSGEFGDVPIYLNPLDRELMAQHSNPKERIAYTTQMHQMVSLPAPFITESDLIPPFDPSKTKPLSNGQIFDLGNITVEAIHTPGHTQGMTMLLIPELRIILFGDGCGMGVLLVEDCCSTVAVYRQSLLHLKKYEARYDRIIRNHGSCESSKAILDNVIEVCDDILSGSDDKIPAEHCPIASESPIFQAKATIPNSQIRIDRKEGNIIYALHKIK